jgi:hypothetical protein
MKLIRINFLVLGLLQFGLYILQVLALFGNFPFERLISEPFELLIYMGVPLREISFPLAMSISACMIALLLQAHRRRLLFVMAFSAIILLLLGIYLGYLLPYIPSAVEGTAGEPSTWFPGLSQVTLEVFCIVFVEFAIVLFALIKVYKLRNKTKEAKLRKFSVSESIALVALCIVLLIICKAGIAFLPKETKQQLPPTYDSYGTKLANPESSVAVVSADPVSPDHMYTMQDVYGPTKVTYQVTKSDGTVYEGKSYTYGQHRENGKEVSCNCAVSFKGWKDSRSFVVHTEKDDGSQYEDIVDITKLKPVPKDDESDTGYRRPHVSIYDLF